MQIHLWKNFSKKINSTKRPNDNEKEIRDVVLKEDCSLESPIFILEGPIDISYNYLAWNFSYFYITDMVYIANNLYEIYTSRDCLATYKNIIGNYNTFIERSASNYDLMIPDNNISGRTNIVDYAESLTEISSWDRTGCYIMRTSSGGGQLGVSTYVLTLEQLQDSLLFCTGGIQEEIEDEFLKAAFNPMQYVLDIKWYPLNPDVISTSKVSKIKFGKYEFNKDTPQFRIVTTVGIVLANIVIQYPSSRYYNDWRDFSTQYTNYQLYLPSVGLVPVQATDITSDLLCSYYIDYVTGDSNVILHKRSGIYVAQFSGKIGIDVNVSQLSVNGSQIVGGVASGVANVAAGNYLGAATSLVSAASTFLQPTQSQISKGAGGLLSLKNLYKIALVRTTFGSAEKPNTIGIPCCKNLTINTLSGYVKCGQASLDIAGHPADKETVNSYLNSGFYFE